MFLSVIVPVYNEEAYLEKLIGQQLTQLKRLNVSFELIISENGSQDSTPILATKIAKHHNSVRVITNTKADYGLAVRNGFLAARGQYLVLFDLDYFDTGFLKKTFSMLPNCSAVIGRKRGKGAADQRSQLRRMATWVFSSLLHFGFGLQLSDTHGIKILNRQDFLPLISHCQFNRDIFDTELLIRGFYYGLSINEIGVSVKEKRSSRTSIARRAMRTIKDLLLLKITFLGEYGL